MTPASPVVATRLAAQLLSGAPAGTCVDVVERLLAVQAQDPRGARLAVRARTSGLLAADVDRCLTVERSLLISWLNRGTLHLVRSEDYWWLHQLTTPQLVVGNARRLGQEGVPPDAAERGVAAVTAALTADGPLPRSQLRERIRSAGVRVEGQALVHVLMLTCLRGIAARGPVVNGEHAYVLVRDWLGAPPPAMDRTGALAELARRFLAGHGPATDRDLTRWAGLPLGDVRRGLAQIAGALRQREDGLLDVAERAAPDDLPPPTLLGPFDPLLMGWTSRQPILGGHEGIITVNGIFRPFAFVRGAAVATWSVSGRMALAPFAPLAPADVAALEAEAADVTRFLGGVSYR